MSGYDYDYCGEYKYDYDDCYKPRRHHGRRHHKKRYDYCWDYSS